jgi:RNA ligase (TIGR02306 family)
MSFFGVTVERISKVLPHPRADRLDIVQCAGMGYPMVVKKGLHVEGEQVLYFPVDALIPAGLADKLGVRKYLAGESNDRVKTVVLRGEPSQGLAAALSVLADYGVSADSGTEAITAALGVTKFVPPLKEISGGRLVPLPDGLSVYDIENCERSQQVIDFLMDRYVVVTEKAEGANLNVTLETTVTPSREVFCMHSNAIEMEAGADHVYISTAKKDGLDAFVRYFANLVGQKVTAYAEILGPGFSGNYYQIDGNRVALFDVKVGGRWFPWEGVLDVLDDFNTQQEEVLGEKHVPLYAVPTVFIGKLRDFLAGRTVREASHGVTRITLPLLPGKNRTGLLREGVVIKDAMEESMPTSFSRVIIKQRCPVYLAATGH